MSACIIDGKAAAAELNAAAREKAEALRSRGIDPHLAVILVGENAASQTYVRSKERACQNAGIRSTVLRLPETCTAEELEERIQALNADPGVHGILVQLPLPGHLDSDRILEKIAPEKDVDGFHRVNMGSLVLNRPGFVPCTPLGIMHLLERSGINPCGKHAVVVGRSHIVGRPMALLLLSADATVTVCHSRTGDLASYTRQADILIAAAGKPGIIKPDMVKPGAVVIDVGINRVDGKLTGDVDEGVRDVAGYLTPVPGGVGPMTVAMLLQNTLQAAEHAC